jgi:hypothetical protein
MDKSSKYVFSKVSLRCKWIRGKKGFIKVRDQNGLSLFKYSSTKDLYAANGTKIKKK